jgi:hypothetical protein
MNYDHDDVMVGTPAFWICPRQRTPLFYSQSFFIIFLNSPSAFSSCHIGRYIVSAVEKQLLNEP